MNELNAIVPALELLQTRLEQSHTFDSSYQIITSTLARCNEQQCHRILIDLTVCNHPITIADVCKMVNRIIKVNKGKKNRYAFIVEDCPKQRDIAQLLELCLMQGGISARCFYVLDEGTEWLKNGTPAEVFQA